MSAISKLNPQIQSYAVFYYVKLQRPFVCLSVCTPPPPFFDTTVGPQPNLAYIFG